MAKASRGINGRLTPRRKHDVSDRVPARRHVEIGFTTVRLDPTILCGYCACPFRSCADTVRVLSVLRVLSVPCPFRSFRLGHCPTINDRHLLITRSTRRMSEKVIARDVRRPYDGRGTARAEDRPGRGLPFCRGRAARGPEAMRWGLGPVFFYECLANSRRWQTYAIRSAGVALLLAAIATIAMSQHDDRPDGMRGGNMPHSASRTSTRSSAWS